MEMKRDMDLIRTILLYLGFSNQKSQWNPVEIEGYTRAEISYHIKLLDRAGLVEAKDFGSKEDDFGLADKKINLEWS